jgi:hypothetical protein
MKPRMILNLVSRRSYLDGLSVAAGFELELLDLLLEVMLIPEVANRSVRPGL